MIHVTGQTITAPSGWTQLMNQADGSTLVLYAYWKIATGSEPSTYAFSWATAAVCAWSYREISGQNGTTTAQFIDSTANQSSSNTVTTTNPQVTSTVTPTNANCLVLADFAFGGSDATFTFAAGSSTAGTWTQDYTGAPATGSNQPNVAGARLTQTTAAATACACTVSVAHSAAMWIGGIVPAAAAVPGLVTYGMSSN